MSVQAFYKPQPIMNIFSVGRPMPFFAGCTGWVPRGKSENSRRVVYLSIRHDSHYAFL